MSFLANSLRACFYRIHGERSTRAADLCFQRMTPEWHRGPDGTILLLLRRRKRRAAPEGCRAGRTALGRRGKHEEGRA